MGVAKDLVRAHLWFTLAAEEGHPEATTFADVRFISSLPWSLDGEALPWSLDGEAEGVIPELEGQMTSREIAEAKRMAREWSESHDQ